LRFIYPDKIGTVRADSFGGAAGGLPAMLRKAIAGGGGRRAGANTLKFDIFCKPSASKTVFC